MDSMRILKVSTQPSINTSKSPFQKKKSQKPTQQGFETHHLNSNQTIAGFGLKYFEDAGT